MSYFHLEFSNFLVSIDCLPFLICISASMEYVCMSVKPFYEKQLT